MGAAGARLDAYAHNPYPLKPFETPSIGGCAHCETITMSTLERLQREVSRAFGSLKRIWLTEYGYQTSPPDRALGVSKALQARYVSEAAYRAFAARNVDMLIQYLYKDEPDVARWQSGYIAAGGSVKLSYRAAQLPLAQVSRVGVRTVLWGQVRSGSGPQRYMLQQFRDGGWRSVGGGRDRRTRTGSSAGPFKQARARRSGSGIRRATVVSPLAPRDSSPSSPGCGARGTPAGPPGPRRSCGARRSGARSPARRAGRGRASSRAARLAGLRSRARPGR